MSLDFLRAPRPDVFRVSTTRGGHTPTDWAYSYNRPAVTEEGVEIGARAEAFRTTLHGRGGAIRRNLPFRRSIEQPTEWRAETNHAAETADGLLTDAQFSPFSQCGQSSYFHFRCLFWRPWLSISPYHNPAHPAAKFTDYAKTPPRYTCCALLKSTMGVFATLKPNGETPIT